ncbi:MAG: class I SAM-dependent methyltransferase [Pseudonocardiaceae bacterium]
MPILDPRAIVRRGYDAVSHRYRSDDARPGDYEAWIRALRERVAANGAVLDLGCGCGVPVACSLTNAGYAVTGVDHSEVQIRRARDLVPAATFIQTDVTTMDFPSASFDAVVCLYTLIHLPLDEQAPLLSRIATWLRPGGWLLTTTGHHAWTGTVDNWLGGGAPMWWSHADDTTYRAWITHAGLIVEDERIVPEGAGGHSLFWARRP